MFSYMTHSYTDQNGHNLRDVMSLSDFLNFFNSLCKLAMNFHVNGLKTGYFTLVHESLLE